MSSAFISVKAIGRQRSLPYTSSPVYSKIWHSSSAPFATAASFDPVAPDATTLLGFGIVVIVCAIAAYVWSNQVVPISRTKLALAKQKNSNSELRQYLDELATLDKFNATSDAKVNVTSTASEQIDSVEVVLNDFTDRDTESQRVNDRSFERWLFTDWLEQDKRRRIGGRQKEPAIPILKTAKWNSGDNPVLAATALILSGVLFTAISERISDSF
jgi:type II secretory pathway component PulM